MTQPEVAAAMRGAMARAEAQSPFLARLIRREAALASELAAGSLPDLTRLAPADEPSLARRLRIERGRLALAVAVADLAGVMDFRDVTTALSGFADRALDAAITGAVAERYPGAEPRGLAAIALGKQGSGELNYSSDIDPILLFDPATLPRHAREEPQDAAVRLAKRVLELLQARDGDGYVLRVDLRLRPSPEATPIAVPVDAAIGYYESLALPWERAAFIRARAAAGDVALGERFLAAIQPFVWRRTLDFGAVAELREITRRIRDHHSQGQSFGPGYDVKRGRGGIREAEFFAQIHQLIHGGRDPSLRAPATLDALAALAAAGRIGRDEADQLRAAYVRLRTVEHRLQMVEDRQTHRLPEGSALDGVARLDGLPDAAALLADLTPHVAAVAAIYETLAPAPTHALSVDPERLVEQLSAVGVDAAAAEQVRRWRSGAYPALRSATAQTALEAVLPALVAAFGASSHGERALVRFDALLSRLPTAVNVLRLLAAQPALVRLLGDVLGLAPTLADALARQPALLDPLIDASAFAALPPLAELAAELRSGGDYQAQLDHVRRLVGEKRFALGVQIVAGAADPLAVASGYARLAEAAVAVLAEATVTAFAAAHGRVPGSELLILALGRFGGAALTHASDLDLVYVFTGDYRAQSDGPKPLGAVHYYNRLAQRVTAALSAPTAAGALYPVDTRLRPSGAQGPLSVSLDGFARYQHEDAWTWEHMALTRARPVFGSSAGRGALDAIVAAVLGGERPPRDIRGDAIAMRAEMLRHKPPAGPLDAKLSDGGLVDLEFATHVRQLSARAGFDPDLPRALGQLIASGLAPAAIVAAHDLLTRLLVTARLVAPDAQLPDAATRELIARALGLADWGATMAAFDAARATVHGWWREVSEEAA